MYHLVAEHDLIDEQIKAYKTKIAHLRSQIERVDVKLEKYSTNDDQFNADHKIETLENRLFHNNQKMSALKQEGIKLRGVVSDLMYRRRQFQIDRDNVTASLMRKKQEILEIVDHYSIGFSNGMKNWQDIDITRIRSAKLMQNHLHEMRHLIRTAESNDILQDFMINKVTPIKLESAAVPQREILMDNFKEASKECDDQLKLVNEFNPKVTPDDLTYKRHQTFALYLYENEIVENIEEIDRGVTRTNEQAAVAREQNEQLKKNVENLHEMKQMVIGNEEEIRKQEERAAQLESMLHQYMKNVHDLYKTLKCDTLFGFEGGESVDVFNLDEVLQIIEIRLRQIMYAVYCWQEEHEVSDKKRYVHDIEIVKPRKIPDIELVNPCPECSQVEARANPEVESLVNFEEKLVKLKESIDKRTMTSQIHQIQDCPKPGSKAVLSKNI